VLCYIFDKNLTVSQHISAISRSCFLNVCDLRHIHATIDQPNAFTVAALFTLKLTIVTIFYTISLPLKIFGFNAPSFLLLVLSQTLLNFIMSLPVLNVFNSWLRIGVEFDVLTTVYHCVFVSVFLV